MKSILHRFQMAFNEANNAIFFGRWESDFNVFECESFLERNTPDIPALCETNLDDSIDSGNLSVREMILLFNKSLNNQFNTSSLWT